MTSFTTALEALAQGGPDATTASPEADAPPRPTLVTPDNIDEIARRASSVDSVTEQEPTCWPEPEPLGYAGEPSAFPVDALPGTLRAYVTALSEASQTLPDLAGTLVLCALAAIAGGRLRVVIREGWDQPLNLYAAVGLPPASRKSDVFRRVVAPIRERERDLCRAAAPEIRAAQERRMIADELAVKARKTAMTGPAGERQTRTDQAVRAREEADSIEVPPEPRLLADDATPEALTSLLAIHHGRIAILSDEGGVFDAMAGRYSAQINLDVYLKAWDGGDLRVDRKGRPSEIVERPALTVGLAVQPQVLRGLGDRGEFAGRGLLGRFLYALPKPNIGRRSIASAPVPRALEQEYAELMRDLAEMLDELPANARLFFDRDADELMRRFEESHERRLGEAGHLGHIDSWAGKLPGTLARLAGLMHLASVAHPLDNPISAATLQRALTLGEYYISHALAVFDLMWSDPKLADARRVLEWLRDREEPGAPFTRRELHRALQGRFRTASACIPALELLERKRYIAPLRQNQTGPGRPRSATYCVNPALHEAIGLRL